MGQIHALYIVQRWWASKFRIYEITRVEYANNHPPKTQGQHAHAVAYGIPKLPFPSMVYLDGLARLPLIYALFNISPIPQPHSFDFSPV